jgi:hypothetical protein
LILQLPSDTIEVATQGQTLRSEVRKLSFNLDKKSDKRALFSRFQRERRKRIDARCPPGWKQAR